MKKGKNIKIAKTRNASNLIRFKWLAFEFLSFPFADFQVKLPSTEETRFDILSQHYLLDSNCLNSDFITENFVPGHEPWRTKKTANSHRSQVSYTQRSEGKMTGLGSFLKKNPTFGATIWECIEDS